MNMGDLIQREWVLKRMVFEPDYEVVQMAPAVDAEPVRHGRWVEGGYACGESEWTCTACGNTEWRTSSSRLKWCPYCGAKMDQEV